MVLSDGGDKTFAQVTAETGDPLGWKWPDVLPAPVVEGDTATYKNVVEGGDLVVTAHATGFTHTLVLNERPAEPVEFAIPVTLSGAELTEDADGSLAVETQAGQVLVESPQPLMWDSTSDAGGQPENLAPVDAAVTETAAGGTTLTLSPDEGFLADPDTVYPVTVDPSFTTYATGDTWVQNADYTSSQQFSQELRAGTYDGGGHKARSFLWFNDNVWDGKHVTDAKLRMRNFYSGSCTGAAIQAVRITQDWTVAGVTWGNQPGAGPEHADNYTPAKGYNSTCGSGDAEWSLTAMVDDWAQGRFPFRGIRLKAVDETSNNTWRKYRSANYPDYPYILPRLVVTYNNFPNKADTPTVAPGNTGYTTTKTPTLKSKLTDTDGGELRGKFTVYNSAGAAVWTGYSCTSIANANCTSSGGTAT
ncbi:MAG: DNRLRE domain-containing protein, partial [Stackebrandtia sp.]